MSSVGKPERVTQNRVIALFRDEGATDRTRSVDKDGLRTVGKR